MISYLGLTAGVVAAFTVAGGNPSPDAQQWQHIRVVSASHRIDFPDGIELRLEATADADISEVTVYYRIGGRNSTVYGYPEFEASTEIESTFTFPTSGQFYIPPGVEIEYHYVIRDIDGNSLETEPLRLEYLDPTYRWQRLHMGDLELLWHDRPRGLVGDVAADVIERSTAAKELLGISSPSPMKAVILNSAGETSRSFPNVSDAASRGHVYGGFALGEFDTFVLGSLSVDGMVHEMTHLYIDEAIEGPGVRVPSWLNEGIAMYFESGPRGRDRVLARAAVGNQLIPLRSMGAVPGRPDAIRNFYAQSWSIVGYLIDRHGEERMSELLAEIGGGSPIEIAVETVYGKSLEQLDADWRDQLSRRTNLIPRPDPGTFGTSLLIGGAVVAAILAVGFRWLRRQVTPPDIEDTEL